MVLVDVNLLIYAVFEDTPRHARAREWLEGMLGGTESIAWTWPVLMGFVRLSTNPRVVSKPFALEEAISYLHDWLALPSARMLDPLPEHAETFVRMLRAAQATGNLVSDAHLAALAIERDCVLASTDRDFQKFPGLRWINPIPD